MASPAQILANRENAQRSTGPKTLAGKTAASRNATRHGLTGAQIVIPGEDPAAFEQLRKGLHQSYKPANDAESVLVEQIAANAWRLMRAHRVEAAFFAQLSDDAPNPEAAIAIAFLERPADIARIQRYVNAANSAYHKALNQLAKLQNERAGAEQDAPEQPEIGFVSHVEQVEHLEQSVAPASDISAPDSAKPYRSLRVSSKRFEGDSPE